VRGGVIGGYLQRVRRPGSVLGGGEREGSLPCATACLGVACSMCGDVIGDGLLGGIMRGVAWQRAAAFGVGRGSCIVVEIRAG
jgi:hypothetical protein